MTTMTAALLLSLMLAQATPAPVATGPCIQEPQIVNEVQPVRPASLPNTMFAAIAIVKVLVGTDGSVEQATISKSSGYPAVDAAVLKAARATTFSPKVVDCKPVEGVYLLKAGWIAP